MRRLLTGYAVTFNRRYRRCGRLFQNRYKSILCQEDTYLLELVRYIHLNPIRARMVKDLKSLDSYAHTGHSGIMEKRKNPWQDTDSVLQRFGKRQHTARKKYRDFVEKGVGRGRNPKMTGRGLLRSVGGWGVLKSMRRMKIHVKGDERILGDSHFVETVLSQASEQMERQYRLKAEGWTLAKITERVAEIFGIEKDQIFVAGKHPKRVHTRSVSAYWAIRYLGLSATEVGKQLGLSKSAVSRAFERGRQMVAGQSLTLEE
jgi:putative transposase